MQSEVAARIGIADSVEKIHDRINSIQEQVDLLLDATAQRVDLAEEAAAEAPTPDVLPEAPTAPTQAFDLPALERSIRDLTTFCGNSLAHQNSMHDLVMKVSDSDG